ncbi:MAG: hypothetical protein PHF72_14985 [Gammaproteobacteria bacterium]|nr:hypothetical protein [Gammaproteobacteria bacterium]
MKKITGTLIVIAGLAAGALAPFSAHAGINDRQDRQDRRIEQGVKSGELTRGERRYLEEEQRRINRLERRFRSDGRLTKRERSILDAELDRLSRQIKAMKHNRLDRDRRDDRRYSWDYRPRRDRDPRWDPRHDDQGWWWWRQWDHDRR